MKKRIRQASQAYNEFPWRKQVRWLMRALAGVIVVSAVLALEVHLSAQAVLLGHQTRLLQRQTLQKQEKILDLQTRLAEAESVGRLLQQAEARDYRQVVPSQAHFVPAPAEVVMGADMPVPKAASAVDDESSSLPKEYTISLLRWLEYYLLLEPTP